MKDIVTMNEQKRKEANDAFEAEYGAFFHADTPDDTCLFDNLKVALEEWLLKKDEEERISSPDPLNSDDVTQILAIPHFTSYRLNTGTMERDPISGNPRPRYVTQKYRPLRADDLKKFRKLFEKCLAALTNYAKRIDSPTYLDLRALYVDLRAHDKQRGYDVRESAEEAAQLHNELVRLLTFLNADVEIANAAKKNKKKNKNKNKKKAKEVRHG